MNGEPLAYFLTWTTYGTWLPGDERGWVQWREGFQQPSEPLRQYAAAKMVESAVTLDPEQRQVVDSTIQKHCEIRNWALHARNVRTNHVHAVVTASGYAPDIVVQQFKAWCSRKLTELALSNNDHNSRRTHWWTEGASKRWINRDTDLISAVEYVLMAQDRPR